MLEALQTTDADVEANADVVEALQTTDGRAMKAYENRNLNFETGTIEPFRPTIANMYDGWECINEMVRRGLVEHKKSHSTYVTTWFNGRIILFASMKRTQDIRLKSAQRHIERP